VVNNILVDLLHQFATSSRTLSPRLARNNSAIASCSDSTSSTARFRPESLPPEAENLGSKWTPRWSEGYSNWRFHDEFMAAK
jgi:hypothetical protein